MASEGFLIIVLLCFAAVPTVFNTCPDLPGVDVLQFGGTCYLFVISATATYSAALNTCLVFGGVLAVVRNAATQRFLEEQLSERFNHSPPVWIGMTRPQEKSTFLLPDGSEPIFWNWASGEPRNPSAPGACVAMDAGSNGAWRTYPCSKYFSTDVRLGHVCELESTTPSFSLSCTPPSLPLFTDLVAYDHSCLLFVVSQTASYHAAHDTCRVYGGHLAVIRDERAQLFFQNQLRYVLNYFQPMWLGLVRGEPGGLFYTSTGAPAEYLNLIEEEEGKTINTKSCVAMDPEKNGGWKVYPCSALQHKFGHICEFSQSDIAPSITQTSAGISTTLPASSTNLIVTTSVVFNATQDVMSTITSVAVDRTTPTLTETNVTVDATDQVATTIVLLPSPSNQTSPIAVSSAVVSSTDRTLISETSESQTTTLTSASSSSFSPTTVSSSSVSASSLEGSVCQQCGNVDWTEPCSEEDLLLPATVRCDDATPYCMNDIYQNDGQVLYYKRCVSWEVCAQLWYEESSDRIQCVHYDPVVYTEDLVCHLCCYGDTCNSNVVPPADTLFNPH